jgi:LIVCS family branched-chain amino acid:cation transporter
MELAPRAHLQGVPMEHTNRFSLGQAIFVGIAIFTMFFGAGNLVYPIEIGMTSGTSFSSGLLGFLLTAVCLPLVGLISMVLFDGNYNAFFERLGRGYARNAIFIAMLILGPIIAIPRIVTLSHVMIAPFLPIPFLQTISYASSTVFALIFLGITFLAAYKETKLISLLGNIIGPIKIASLAFIILKGCYSIASWNALSNLSGFDYAIFKEGFLEGFGTLDLLAAIFFSAMIIHLLRVGVHNAHIDRNKLVIFGVQSSIIGASLLALFYAGLAVLGFLYGPGLSYANPGELFRKIAFEIMGTSGAVIIALTVMMACLSTSIALNAVFAEYLQSVWPGKLRFDKALALSVLLCLPLSIAGLGYVLQIAAGPVVRIGYPVLIVLTVCNVAYKLFGFTWVKVPVVLTLLASALMYHFN